MQYSAYKINKSVIEKLSSSEVGIIYTLLELKGSLLTVNEIKSFMQGFIVSINKDDAQLIVSIHHIFNLMAEVLCSKCNWTNILFEINRRFQNDYYDVQMLDTLKDNHMRTYVNEYKRSTVEDYFKLKLNNKDIIKEAFTLMYYTLEQELFDIYNEETAILTAILYLIKYGQMTFDSTNSLTNDFVECVKQHRHLEAFDNDDLKVKFKAAFETCINRD